MPFLKEQIAPLLERLMQHIYLSFSAIFVAILISIPMGIFIKNTPRLRGIISSFISVCQTIPSLAMLAFLIPILGIGIKPTIFTLTLYALLPIVRSVDAGLSMVPKASIEAAHAMGFNSRQSLWYIELPLASSTLLSGIRVASAMTIGITTIAAFIGAGGLGDFITQGLALNNTSLILLGAIPTAILALLADFMLATLQESFSHFKRRQMKFKKTKYLITSLTLTAVLLAITNTAITEILIPKNKNITVGCKNFSEQYILGEIIAQLIENKTSYHVIRKFGLSSTTSAHHALVKGDIDIYPEYTGTAYMIILNQHHSLSKEKIHHFVKAAYQKQFSLEWLMPFGFNNSESLIVTTQFKKKHQLTKISDLQSLATSLTIGAPPEFLKRADGLPLLTNTYKLNFKKIIQMEPDLMYPAIREGKVDVIAGFTTDPRIAKFQLNTLTDNLNIYPHYDAAAIIRAETLKAHPELRPLISTLNHRISQKIIRHLNSLIQTQHLTAKQIARQYLIQQHLIPL